MKKVFLITALLSLLVATKMFAGGNSFMGTRISQMVEVGKSFTYSASLNAYLTSLSGFYFSYDATKVDVTKVTATTTNGIVVPATITFANGKITCSYAPSAMFAGITFEIEATPKVKLTDADVFSIGSAFGDVNLYGGGKLTSFEYVNLEKVSTNPEVEVTMSDSKSSTCIGKERMLEVYANSTNTNFLIKGFELNMIYNITEVSISKVVIDDKVYTYPSTTFADGKINASAMNKGITGTFKLFTIYYTPLVVNPKFTVTTENKGFNYSKINNPTSTGYASIIYPSALTCSGIYDCKMIEGTASLASSPVSSGNVILFKKGTTETPAIEIKPISTDGTYSFEVLEAGDYYLQVIPNQATYKTALPTYYVSKYASKLAAVLSVKNSIRNVNIALNSYTPSTGTGKISGKVNIESSIYESSIYGGLVLKGTKETTVAAAGMPLLLLNNAGEAVNWTTIGADGSYTFDNIAFDTYKLDIGKADYDKTSDAITINATTPTKEATLELKKTDATTKIKDITIATGLKLYPNPAINDAIISMDMKEAAKVKVEVLSVAGQVIISNTQNATAGSFETKLNIKDLAKGLYLVKITLNDKENRTIKLVK